MAVEHGTYKTESARVIDEKTIEVVVVNKAGRHGDREAITLVISSPHGDTPSWNMSTEVRIIGGTR